MDQYVEGHAARRVDVERPALRLARIGRVERPIKYQIELNVFIGIRCHSCPIDENIWRLVGQRLYEGVGPTRDQP